MKTIKLIILFSCSFYALHSQSVVQALAEIQQENNKKLTYPIIKEYKQVINHKQHVVVTDIRIIIQETEIKILYFNPNTNFKELFKKDEYKIEKYVGEMPPDQKGYGSLVFTCPNNLIFSVHIKSTNDHWCMLSPLKGEIEGHTIFQDPK